MDHISTPLERVVARWPAETAVGLLAHIDCPSCGVKGSYETFRHETVNHVGLRCRACGCKHPFGPRWLPQGAPKRSNDIQRFSGTMAACSPRRPDGSF